MSPSKEFISFLAHKAYLMRKNSIIMTTNAASGHPTSALSAADIVATLFFHTMYFDPHNPNNPNNDRFILSKGHASPILYAVWKELGVLTEQDLATYRSFNSVLEGHPTPRFSRSEAATGSLGQGLSIGVGMALNAKMHNLSYRTYVLLGDAECAEGSVWEAAELAAHYNLDNLTAIIDVNRLGQSCPTMEQWNLEEYANKFAAFGWEPLLANGHLVQDLVTSFGKAKKVVNKPSIIIAKTVKGYGVSLAQNKEGFHGKPFPKNQLNLVLKELEESAGTAVKEPFYSWQPNLPENVDPVRVKTIIELAPPCYTKGQMIATRHAYSQALVEVGAQSQVAVVIDGDVQNSTGTELFAKAYPDRFIEGFVAEQNMIGMAVGLATRGNIPFVATFGAFLTRAHDQIRMAAIGNAPLRLCGSHAGVSIGEDGPSQMALEDIGLMRSLPNSVVLYPADAVASHKLVELSANYHDGISYIRTTRGATPVMYDNDDEFNIGGFALHQYSPNNKLCIITAGITLFEAFKAATALEKEGVYATIVDLYCIKPIDEESLLEVVKTSNNRVITVEDHYLEGGLGEAVCYALRNSSARITCLAVKKLPRSGKSETLLAYEEINAEAIVKAAHKIIS